MCVPRGVAGSFENPTILLVDDQREVRLLLYRILESAGYTVLSAGNAADALLICEQYGGQFHLLISEIQLPDTSGVDLAKGFQQRYPGTPVLFVSASATLQDVQDGLSEPLRGLLTKPFERQALLQKVQEAMILKRTQVSQ